MVRKTSGTPGMLPASMLVLLLGTAAATPVSAIEDVHDCVAFAVTRGVDERTAAIACDAGTTTAERCRELLGPFMSGREAAEACRIR
ncbi:MULTISPECIES: hypothetical protein [Actinoalloteichus]|uniref:Uncharacterized protein n=1 Tax=Actinoalloteichus fjordicus TaxID=1612552 RepID=A0AAC9LF22_9PSEU|nr:MULTISPECIES: hypothetical protein [Actinoalloteichus]APU15044.1 hypothetical protein UA74_14940 [Actinoalloteichus fjordicus]APU21112.1 hypothetical protein UA75_15510 [Actinoalloteichus sp. GBA129-24]